MNLHVLQIIFCEKCFHEFFLHFRARALYLRGDNVIKKNYNNKYNIKLNAELARINPWDISCTMLYQL